MYFRAITVFCLTAVCALLLASPAAVYGAIPRYSTDPQDFVSTGLEHFWVNGDPFRFTGYNIRGMCHYGGDDILRGSLTEDREVNLAYMENVGARVARVFVSNKFRNNYTIGDRLNATLAVAAAHNVYVIVAFTDEYHTGFSPVGDDQYYDSGSGPELLGSAWFNGGYNNYYLPQVLYLVNRFKNDPTVFAWQLGNELKCWWDWPDVLPFSHDVALQIRAIDENHMVSHGTAGRNFSHLTWAEGVQLYQDFDFLTVHTYNGSDYNNDASLATYLGKPFFIEEAGFSSDDYTDRPSATNSDIAKWVGRGARGYMNWGLMATDHDNGDGDFLFGIDYVCTWKDHDLDFDAYTQVYSTWSTMLSNTPIPLPQSTLDQAKSAVNGTDLYITNCTVTAAYDGEFYVQQDRITGIGIVWDGPVTEGDTVNVVGTISTSANGERKITAIAVQQVSP